MSMIYKDGYFRIYENGKLKYITLDFREAVAIVTEQITIYRFNMVKYK